MPQALVRGLGKIANDDPLDFRPLMVGSDVVVVLAADDVGVHSAATDVFADLVEQQDVGRLKGQPRDPLFGQDEQLLLAIFEFVGCNGLNFGRFIVGVLDDADSGDDAAFGEDFAGDAADDLTEAVVHDGAVIDFCAFVLAQADEHHFHQARFDIADEIRMRLDAADDEHVIGAEGVLIEMHGKAFGGLADDDGFHAGADGAAAVALGDAVAFDELALAFGSAAAVATHGGDDKGLSAE